jgi:Holliday junction DNA helicase RuvA
MIAQLKGGVIERGVDYVILDVGGVGYRLIVSLHTLAALPAVGHMTRVRTYLQVREDALTLFGFATEEERNAFDLCTSVQGIGPKLAMSILSTLEPQELASAVAAGDHSRLKKIPGIGKKTAERLVLELKDKVGAMRGAPAATPAAGKPQGAVVSALVNLGYRPAEAERAATQAEAADANAPVEKLLKAALRILAE